MIILNSSTQSIVAHCDATATVAPTYHSAYGDHLSSVSFTEGNKFGSFTDTTDVTVVSAPSGVRRVIRTISVYNADSIDQNISVSINDNGTQTEIFNKNIPSKDNLIIDTEVWPRVDTQGQTGIQGVTGVQGQTGLQGVTGFYGQTGIQGLTGFYGQTGIQGSTGIKGETGIQGIQGETGIQGVTGLALGQTGIQGITGILGTSGGTGGTGIQGQTGIQGVFTPAYGGLYQDNDTGGTNISITSAAWFKLLITDSTAMQSSNVNVSIPTCDMTCLTSGDYDVQYALHGTLSQPATDMDSKLFIDGTQTNYASCRGSSIIPVMYTTNGFVPLVTNNVIDVRVTSAASGGGGGFPVNFMCKKFALSMFKLN